MYLKRKENFFDKDKILSFLEKLNAEFHPPLSTKVNFDDYIDKIFRLAEFFCFLDDDGELIGLLVMYANDKKALAAHITLLAVDPKYRGRKIASRLLSEAKIVAKDSALKRVKTVTWKDNQKAIRLYNKMGFNMTKSYENKYGVKEVLMEIDV